MREIQVGKSQDGYVVMSGDVDTQDICSTVREADESGEKDSVFFLYVATPGKPPSSLHKKIIEPFLKANGWQKVSYKNTGFRALYFMREKNEGLGGCSSLEYQRQQDDDDVVVLSSDDENESDYHTQLKKAAKLHNDSFLINPTQNATNHRSELKKRIEDFKKEKDLSFNVHIVLSRPIDYVEDFVALADSPNSIEF